MTSALPNADEPVLRICPQCGTETHALACRRDGFATVERARHAGPGAVVRTGEVLAGRWRLDEILRGDGLAVLYRGYDLTARCAVAVRLVHAEVGGSLDRIARFQREGRLLAQLDHPNLLRTFEHGVAADGTLFVAEELCSSENLERVLARGPLPVGRVLEIGRDLFDGLAEAHAHGIQHRSLSLANVRVVPEGDQTTIKVDGFGWVRILAEDDRAFTFPRELHHAFATMAPEQARGRGVSGHADVYSVGAILYALMTGRPPFGDGTPSDLLVAHAVKMPPTPERDGAPLRGPFIDFVMRCLEKKPWNRPDGAAAALELLLATSAQPLTPQSPTAVMMTPLPLPKPAVSAAAEAALERTAVPFTVPTGRSPRVVRSTRPELATTTSPGLPAATSHKPTVTALSAPTAPGLAAVSTPPGGARRGAEDPRPTTTRPLIESPLAPTAGGRSSSLAWVAGLALAVAGGVALGMALSGPSATPVVAAAGPTEPTVLAASPAPPEAAPAPVETAAGPTAPASPPPVASPAAAAVTAPAPAPPTPAPAAPASAPPAQAPPAPAPPAVVKPAEARVDKRPPKPAADPIAGKPAPSDDPFADLEDPTVVPRATAPVTHKVLVDSDPGGATVAIDGRVVGVTPLYVEWDDVGQNPRLDLQKAGYRPTGTRLGPRTGTSIVMVLTRADTP